ncbi:MAG: chemotaxis protein CheB [Ignavibacteriales bacterium]
MKILVVEDNVPSRLLLTKILKKEGYDSLYANNGAEALELLKKEVFDAILTDWMMPKLDGIELTRYIRKNIVPPPVILVITALDSRDARNRALEAGADDYIAKPYHIKDIKERLENSIQRRQAELGGTAIKPRTEKPLIPSFIGVGIAASTGGPSTLLQVFSKLKPTSSASIFLVLHGPAWMLKSFAERIQDSIDMKVRLAEDSMPVKKGEIYLAPGDIHMLINSGQMDLKLWDGPAENYVRPSADPLFRSIAKTFGINSLAVVLTGMGHDGSIGSGYISAAGGTVIAQDPSTAIAPSMPQSIIDLRIARIVSHLDDLPGVIEQNIEKKYSLLMQSPDGKL